MVCLHCSLFLNVMKTEILYKIQALEEINTIMVWMPVIAVRLLLVLILLVHYFWIKMKSRHTSLMVMLHLRLVSWNTSKQLLMLVCSIMVRLKTNWQIHIMVIVLVKDKLWKLRWIIWTLLLTRFYHGLKVSEEIILMLLLLMNQQIVQPTYHMVLNQKWFVRIIQNGVMLL